MNKKKILITGGTGTLGKAFIRYVYKNYKPKKLIVYSRDEFKQFEMSKDFPLSNYPGIRFFLGDVRDKKRIKSATIGIDYVIHAAALKHVPIAEYNPQESIKTNVIGAQNLIEACIENNVKKVIALSTDKACNPINLYGATKLVSDKLFISSNILSAHTKTLFSIVRYGNVINSRGSVIPIFQNAKIKKEPMTITDSKMTRFFITIEDAVKFIIKSLDIMEGGEIFIPKLPSIKIIDLAKSISPKSKIKIIGIRPGEKLHESLFSKEDSMNVIENKNTYIILPQVNLPKRNLDNIKKKNFKKIKKMFDYNSETNNNFLNKKDISKLIKNLIN